MGIRGDSVLVPGRPFQWNAAEVVAIMAGDGRRRGAAGKVPGAGAGGPGRGEAGRGGARGGGEEGAMGSGQGGPGKGPTKEPSHREQPPPSPPRRHF